MLQRSCMRRGWIDSYEQYEKHLSPYVKLVYLSFNYVDRACEKSCDTYLVCCQACPTPQASPYHAQQRLRISRTQIEIVVPKSRVVVTRSLRIL